MVYILGADTMVLNNVTLFGAYSPVNIHISGSRIVTVSTEAIPEKKGRVQLNFENALAFPGLVNSHDHLDFNLFPQLGDKTYNNYTEWGKHIHEQYKDEIAQVLKVPVALREQWGIYKNLLCGVTTVVNHGERLKTPTPLIHVHEAYQCLHSVQFEKNWRLKLNNPFKTKLPVVIHAGEGIDNSSRQEIDQLIRWNLLRKTLIGVHAIVMSCVQAEKFGAIIWCPASNFFMFNKTAPVEKLLKHTTLLFGTDSTLTAGWNIWDHIRMARKTKQLTDTELVNTLTINAAKTWGIKTATIEPGKKADIVLSRMKDGQNSSSSFFSTNPEDILLVIHNGDILLFDAELHTQMAVKDVSGFSKIYINNTCKYVRGDLPGLIKQIQCYFPGAAFPVKVNDYEYC
jgi:cytosine/adenosine deaminase-related metal-dependent hydrolase